jgi:hypothetical protein
LEDNLGWKISSPSLTFLLSEMLVAQQVEREMFLLTASVHHFLYRATYSATGVLAHKIHLQFVCLFSWRYNPLWLYFHSPVAGFSLLVFEVP